MDHVLPPCKALPPPSLAPLTPADCDVRDFPKMMVDVHRLLGSQFNAQASSAPLAWMVGHKLWYRAFYQLPGGSLPADDAQLCHLAELGADLRSFRKVRALALRGWRECADGRLYHPFVAETVLEAWIDKLLQRLKSGAGNGRKHADKGFVFDPAPLEAALETAGEHLARINPRARALDKLKRRKAPPTGSASGTDLGDEPESQPRPSRLPSQGKERDTSSHDSADSDSGRTPHEPGRAHDNDGRRAWLLDLQAALAAAGGAALADPAVAPGLANLSPILNLLEPGQGPPCDLERDVLPAVRQASARARPRSIRAWSYFAARIGEARDARLRGAPPITLQPAEAPDDRRPRNASDPAAPFAAPDSRRAHTQRRRGAWLELAEERDGPGPDPGDGRGPDGGPAPGDSGRARLA